MASTPLGDIPGARFHAPQVATHASVASNGAAARLGQIGPFAHDIRFRNVWHSPTGGDQGANTASYRRLTMRNGGTSGTATTVLGSINYSASQASLGAKAMTLAATPSLASGEIAYFSQETVGGDDATGTVLRAGQFAVAYEVI